MMPARARIALFAVLCASALVLSAAQSESGSEESSRESSEASASASSGLSSGSMLSRSLSSSLSRSASSSGSSRLSSSASSGSSSHLSSTHSSGSSSHSSGSSLSSNSLNSLGSGSGSSLSQPSLSMSTLSGSVSLPSSGSSYSSSSGSSLDGSSSFSSSGSSLRDPLAASSSSSAVPPPPPPPVPPMSVGSSSSRSRSGSSGSQSQSQQKKDTIHRYTVVKNNNKLFDVEKPIPPKEVNAVVEQEEKKKKTLDEGMRKQVLREDLAKKQAKADLEIQTQSEALAKKIGNDRRSAESEKKRAELEAQERAMELNKKARAQEEHEKRREEGQKKEATEKQLEQTRKAQAAEQNNKNRAAEERTKAQQAEEAKRREEAMKSEEQSFKEDAKKKGLSESKIKQEQGAKRQQEQADKGAAEAKVKNQQEQNNKQALQEQNNKRAESSRKAEERQKQKDKQEAEHKNEESRKNEQQAKKTESTEKKVQEQQQKAESLAKQRAEEDKFKQEQKEKGKVASEAENKREQNAKSTAEQNEKERQRQQEQVQKAKAKEASAAEAREKAEKARAEEAGRKEKEAAAFRQKQAELKAKEAEERQKSDAVAAQKKKEAEALQLKAEQALKQQEGQPWIRIDNPVDDESKLPFDLATWQADLRDENAAQMQGANLVCQYLGYAYALEWGVDKTGAKAQNGNMRFDYWGGAPRVCSGCRHIFSFVQCQKEDNNAITVRNPRHQDGSLVDATTVSWNGQDEWGGNQQAANLFCRSKGYDGALRWVVSKTLGKGQGTSRFQGDGPQGTTIQRCQQCEWAFKTVVCRRKPNKGHRALAEPSPNTGVFSTPVFQYPSGWNFEGAWTYDSRATLTGDFNGDGKTDYARLGGTYIHFFISKGNGQYFTPIYPFPRGWDFTFNEGIWTSLKALDVNGDGKSDIVRTYHTYNHGFIAKGSDAECWNRDGWIPQTCFQVTAFQYPSGWSFSGPWAWGNRATIQGDFNGDGRGDYARLGPTYIHFFISQGNGQWWWPIYAFPPGWNFGTDESTWTSMALDLNGDGRTDIVRAHHTYNHAFIASPNQRCWQTNGWISNTCFQVTAFHYPGGWNFNGVWNFNQKSLVTGDFNGDGFDDYGKLGATYIHLFISKGNGQFYTPVVPFPPGWNFGWDESVWASMPQADFDGDGKVDIIRTHYTYHHGFYARGGDQRCFYVSPRNIMIPQDCFKITTYRYPGGWHFSGGWSFARTYTTVVGDFNGDGKDDYINLGGGRYNHQFFAQ